MIVNHYSGLGSWQWFHTLEVILYRADCCMVGDASHNGDIYGVDSHAGQFFAIWWCNILSMDASRWMTMNHYGRIGICQWYHTPKFTIYGAVLCMVRHAIHDGNIRC